ncbi:amidohydrolase family protein [Phytoactinopolyspora halotolerans]|uniref:Amidohydrolase family protein n=1 Tax=Phytoactinopolyspora halotolerans TaxID=1981512 RepID=A0A6L9SE90_9ACTN|nr:amidohydrolase family protein [Phytoactinopolyspora halotolerans]NEE02390.1 amidohydrolase family protein [Phytoactinopolyspora halotolerans]
MTHRMLLRGGHTLTMDPQLGDLPTADVLIEDDKITAVEPHIEADVDAEIIDATGQIVIPGFVDTHRHTWEAAIRGCAPNATLDDYFVEVLDTFAPVYRPDDVYASNLAGSLECLNAGITTLVDWSHINNTPEHPDAAIAGLREAGIRAQYAYGSANTSLAKYWFNSAEVIPGDDVRRVRETYFPGDDGLLTLALATRGPGFCQDEVVTAEWQLARELQIPITVHVAMGRLAGRFAMVEQLDRLGLLGPDTTYIHSCYFSDHEWQRVADTGGTISIAAQVEMQMGHGWPPVNKSYQFGLRPSLSVDVVTTVPGDMFTQMRAAFGGERARVNATCWEANTGVPETMLTARQMLEMATINGAHVAGLEDRTGSLIPGKQADVVVIDGRSINVAPIIDPVAAVVLCADVSNVDTVIVGGQVRKREGKLVGDVARARDLVEASRHHLVGAAAKSEAAA